MLLRFGSDLFSQILVFCDVVDDLNATAATCAQLRLTILNFKAYQVQGKLSQYFNDGRQPTSQQEMLRWFDLLYNEQIILMGGETNPRRNLLYRPSSKTFRRLCAIGVKRTTDFEAIFHNGKMYVLSGADSISLGVVESYDVLRKAWSEEPSIPGALTAVACATHQGELYLIGGQDRPTGRRSRSIWICNSSKWDLVQIQLQKGRSHHGCVFFQGKVWVAGGILEDAIRPTTTVETIDMQSQSSEMSSMLRKRFRPRMYVINNTLYVVGGDIEQNHETTIEHYDVATKSWELCCIFPVKRPGCASAVVGTRIYVFGGGNASAHNSYDYFDIVQRWGSRSQGAQEKYLRYPNGFNESLEDSLAVTIKF